MQSLGKFPTQAHHNTHLLHKPISQFLQFPSKHQFSFPTRLNFTPIVGKLQNGFYCNASKTKKKGGSSLSEMDGPDELDDDEFDDEFLDVDDDGGFDVGEEEDEIEMPLMNMKKWLENRPRGFGEGKVYDTSVEDKLMDEIEHSKKVQLANVNKLKNNNGHVDAKTGSKKEINRQDKGSALVQDGFRVRLLNLPKKKNIHKDLKLAFAEVRGIINTVPVVSGNEKTRDPVCKGIAFVDFKHQDEAQSFLQSFSGKSISFGKVQKQIKCEMVNTKKSIPEHDHEDDNLTPKQVVVNSDLNNITIGVQNDVPLLESREESVPRVFDNAGEDENDDDDDDRIKKGTSTTTSESDSSKQRRKLKSNEKKVATKRKKDKIPKLNIPGSSNRLKIREKEMLTGVYSKYSATAKELSR